MSRKLRVLSVINELYFGGDENRLLTMARTIDRNRVDLTVVTLKRANQRLEPQYGTMRQQYADAGVDVRDLGEGHPNEGLPLGSLKRYVRAGIGELLTFDAIRLLYPYFAIGLSEMARRMFLPLNVRAKTAKRMIKREGTGMGKFYLKQRRISEGNWRGRDGKLEPERKGSKV